MAEKLGLEEALDIAMDAELQAQAFYTQAAVEVQDPHGRDLLGTLAAFEQYHYQKLFELAQSLRRNGRFIEYETRTMQQFAPLVGSSDTAGTFSAQPVGATLAVALKDPADILIKAIENEKVAGERYRVLAEETTDPAGHDMFRTLADEEMVHERILEDAFFTLSNEGAWGWRGMYGE